MQSDEIVEQLREIKDIQAKQLDYLKRMFEQNELALHNQERTDEKLLTSQQQKQQKFEEQKTGLPSWMVACASIASLLVVWSLAAA